MPQKTVNIKDEIEVEKSFYSDQDGDKMTYYQNGNGLKNYYEAENEEKESIAEIIENASPKYTEIKKLKEEETVISQNGKYQNGGTENGHRNGNDSGHESEDSIMKYVFKDEDGNLLAYGDTDDVPSEYELLKTLRLIIDERKVIVASRKENATSQVWQEMQDEERVEYVAKGPNGEEMQVETSNALPEDYRVTKTLITRVIKGEANTLADLQDDNVWELLDPAEWEEVKDKEVIRYITKNKNCDTVTFDNADKIPEGHELQKTVKLKTFVAEITNEEELEEDEVFKYLYKDQNGELVVLDSNVNVSAEYQFANKVIIKTMTDGAAWEAYGNECEVLQYIVKDVNGLETAIDSLDYLLPGCKLTKVLKMKTIIAESSSVDSLDEQINRKLDNPERWKEMKHCQVIKYIVKDETGKPKSLDTMENLPRGYELVKALKLKTFVTQLSENEIKMDRKVKYFFLNQHGEEIILDRMNGVPSEYTLRKIVQLKVDEEPSENECVQYVFKNRGGSVLNRFTADNPPAGYELIRIVKSKSTNGHG